MDVNNILNKFLGGDKFAASLLRYDFRKTDAALSLANELKNRSISPEIISLLIKDNDSGSAAVQQNLKLLTDKNCRFVITGQQIGILGGPLLTLYKIISTVKTARILTEKLSIPVVPVFWMQTEDHDLKEINSAGFLDNSEQLHSFCASAYNQDNLTSVGNINIPSSFVAELTDFSSELNLSNSNLLLKTYNTENNLGSAFRQFWQIFCAETGILFFDPNNAQVKTLAADLIKKSFSQEHQITSLLKANAKKLNSNGFEEQVYIKSDSPLFFLELDSHRHRLIKSGDNFNCTNHSFSPEQINQLIDSQACRFTSSALIRPILQDFLFPNLAYICGPSEFNYWAQTLELYEFFTIPQPLVIPRSNFRLIEDKYQRILSKSGFKIEDLNLSDSELLNKLVSDYAKPEELFLFINRWQAELDNLKTTFARLDPNLLGPLEQTKVMIQNTISRMEKRYQDSLKLRESNSFNQFRRVKNVLYPNALPQERVVSAAFFLLKYGNQLVDKLLLASEPTTHFKTININL